MPRSFDAAAAVLFTSLVLIPPVAVAAQDPAPDVHADKKHAAKHHPRRIWHGYGFLPGYRTPERIDWDNARARGPQVWYGPPRWYHGQWNHGGFGPCWTETPIGEIWNCGK
jgi:hypothetical protein